jgi:TatD DNase family protein
MIDAHCHLQFEQFDKDRDELINKIQARMDRIILNGVNFKDNRNAREIAEKHDKISLCMGAHPLYEHEIERVEKQIRDNNIAAVGEIGLDYNYITDSEERERSRQVFERMLELAESEGLNVVIHSRNAEDKCFEMIQSYNVSGFFHCFNGRPDLAESIVEKGHLIGVTGQVVDSSRVRNIVERLDHDVLLSETDSPYLGEGDRNTPLYVEKVLNEISTIKGIERPELEKSIKENVEGFFDVSVK